MMSQDAHIVNFIKLFFHPVFLAFGFQLCNLQGTCIQIATE